MKDNNDISQELLEIIERYINGSMGNQELKDFNQLLEVDDDFKIKVEDIKNMLLGIEAQSLKEQLDGFHDDIPNTIVKKPNNNKIRFLNYSKIVAAAAIIIAVGSIWFFSSSPNERLYAKYFKPDPGLPTTMSSTDNFDFYDAMVNYKHGDYEIAIEKWGKLQQKKPNNDTINYFLGVAQLNNNNELKAIQLLKNATQQSESVFLNEAYFYLGLAYLKNNELAKAKESFKSCSSEKSQEIIDNLK